MSLAWWIQQRGRGIPVPFLFLAITASVIGLVYILSPIFCTCPAISTCATATPIVSSTGGNYIDSGAERFSPTRSDIEWIKDQIRVNGIQMQPNILRKGINPRTRADQLQDLINFKGISHYEGSESNNHTALQCPGELLVEEHHSNYGEPWAGGRDVFEFLAEATKLKPSSRVLEIGCGTLRVGLHFIRYLDSEHFHCLERDELSLMAALRYELPSQGLLHKRPLIVKGDNMDFTKFGKQVEYDLIYASAVFLHMPDKLVWIGLNRLATRLKPLEGRLFVSHNIKFCTRLKGDECTNKLKTIGLEYIGKSTHDSLLFNHFEIWFEFRRFRD